MTITTASGEFMHASEVSAMLGFSMNTLAEWRKKRIGPRWRRATKGVYWSRPMYYRESVEKLRDAFSAIRAMGLRAFPNVKLPTSPPEGEAAFPAGEASHVRT